MFVASIGVGFAFNFSSISVMRNVMTYGAFLSFLTYSFQIFEPFKMLAQIFTDLKSAQASAERVFQILYEEDEILEEEESDLDFEGNIKFENVNYKYDDSNEYVLKNINLDVKAGEIVAFVGKSGSGKTTLVNLLARFFNTDEGKITVNGVNIKNIHLDIYRNKKIILCIGQGAWEEDLLPSNHEMNAILKEKNVPAWVDFWGYDVAHDWNWWQLQIRYFMDKVL